MDGQDKFYFINNRTFAYKGMVAEPAEVTKSESPNYRLINHVKKR